MMKKLTKAALLAAATAFLLGGVTACEHEDKDEKPTVGNPSGSDEEDKDPEPSVGDKATAKTYDFATWSEADLEKFGGDFYFDSNGAAKNLLKSPEGTTGLSTGATIYNKGANNIMLRTVSTTDNTPTGLYYNGGQKEDDLSNGVAVSELDRYVSIPVDGAGKITASVRFTSSSGKSGNLQAAFVDSDGKLLGDVVEMDVSTGGDTAVEGTTTGETDVILAFSRNGAGGGGLDVYNISVKPAE